MNGAESLVGTLLEGDVDVCFTNPGTSEMHFVAALDKYQTMRSVLCLFEGCATGAADGYFRMKRSPASTLLHLGPGLANGLSNLHNAKKANSAIVNIVGEHALDHIKLNAPLTSDIEGIAKPVSHWVKTSKSSKNIAKDGAEAIKQANVDLADFENFFNNNKTVLNYIKSYKHVLNPSTFKNSWSLGGSIFFAFTVATTIGYGSFAPSTVGGQIFTVVYALISVPVAGAILVKTAATVLKLVTHLYTMSIDRVDKAFDTLDEDGGGFLDHEEMLLGLKELGINVSKEEFSALMEIIDKDNDNQIDKDEFKHAVTILGADLSQVSGKSAQLQILLMSFVVWMLLGSLYFSLTEDGWSYGHAVYFSFITLSTIGLGDYVPTTIINLIFLYLFTLVGLGMLAVLIKLIREFIQIAQRKADEVAHDMAEKADKKAHEMAHMISSSRSSHNESEVLNNKL